MAEKEFPKGIYFNKPRENAPSWIIGSIALNLAGIDRDQLNEKKNDKGYVYIDVLEGKDGKPYCAFNTYKPERKPNIEIVDDIGREEIDIDSIPF